MSGGPFIMPPRHKDIQLYHTGVRHDSVSVWVGQDSTVAELREEVGTERPTFGVVAQPTYASGGGSSSGDAVS